MVKKKYLLWFVYGLVGFLLLFTITNIPVVADEKFHFGQINTFLHGSFVIDPYISTTPLFHFLIFVLDKVLFIGSLWGTRLLLFTIFLLSIPPLLYKLNNNDLKKTILCLLVPTSFIYFFLVYIDVFSLLFVLAAYFFTVKKKYFLGGFFSLVAIFLRQNNVFIVLFFVYLVWKQEGLVWKNLVWYVVSLLSFGVFVIIKGRVVLGGGVVHPLLLHSNNVYFFGFVFFMLFFPIVFMYKFSKRDLLWVGFVALLGLLSFQELNVLNVSNSVVTYGNLVLGLMFSNFLVKVLVIVLGSISIVFLFKHFNYTLLFFLGLYLGFSWLVDPRYYMVPFVLLLVNMGDFEDWQFWLLSGVWGVLCLLFFCTLFF